MTFVTFGGGSVRRDTSPPVPSGLAVTGQTSSTISLDWGDVSDVILAGYRVERSLDGVSGWAAVGGLVTGSDYTDIGLSASTQYFYRVASENGRGEQSGYSAVVSGTTSAASGETDLAQILFYDNFESYSVGQSVRTFGSPWLSTFGEGVVVDNQVYQGTRSVEVAASGNSTSALALGNIRTTDIDPNFESGVRAWWIRYALRMNSAFNFNGSNKWLRIDGSSPNYSTFVHSDGGFLKARPTTPDIDLPNTDLLSAKNGWILLEHSTHFDEGRVRAWINGVLTDDVPMTGRPSSVSFGNTLRNPVFYWNTPGTAGKTMWFDAFTIAIWNSARDDREHMVTDAAGNKFIGTAL